MQVDSAKGQLRHSADTRDEWERAVSKIGRDFLIKEVRLWVPLAAPISGRNCCCRLFECLPCFCLASLKPC